MRVYLVWGSTGEYEDYREWIAKATAKLDKAKEFKIQAEKDAAYMMELSDGHFRYYSEKYKGIDKNFSMDYTGTYYEISEIEVEDVEWE